MNAETKAGLKTVLHTALKEINHDVFIVFLLLKLTHTVTWSWWIVFIPFLWPLVFIIPSLIKLGFLYWQHRKDLNELIRAGILK